MSAVLYLVRDDDRIQALVAQVDGKLFCYVPDVDEFVYNKPLTADFLINRDKRYDRIDVAEALQLIEEGCIGRIDDHGSQTLMDWAVYQPQRLRPREVLGHGTSGTETVAEEDNSPSE
ncbi:hypothetical protein [Mycobacterium sp. 360MFTsu5.1]|uniref:hypothetical protein n=1 Tax=Mycobacterium sp. 360MFTsu5.1 TaxID=1172186 RepID=UPI00037547B1|nr:hypothetical protein [Mycobacterium sp. 360MFTsu5.1]